MKTVHTKRLLFGHQFSSNISSLNKGDSLFQQGEEVSRLYVVEHGRIQLNRNTIDGTPTVLQVALAGEIIAEASIFSEIYHCSAIAERPSRVFSVRKLDLMDHLHSSTQASIQIMKVLAQQVRDLRTLHEIRNIRSARERTLAYIKLVCDQYGRVEFPMTLKDVAYRLGLSHEAFYRTLKKLEVEGLIKRSKNIISLV